MVIFNSYVSHYQRVTTMPDMTRQCLPINVRPRSIGRWLATCCWMLAEWGGENGPPERLLLKRLRNVGDATPLYGDTLADTYRYMDIYTIIYMPLKKRTIIHFRSIVLSTQIPRVHNLPQIPRIGSKSSKLIQSQLPIGGLSIHGETTALLW